MRIPIFVYFIIYMTLAVLMPLPFLMVLDIDDESLIFSLLMFFSMFVSGVLLFLVYNRIENGEWKSKVLARTLSKGGLVLFGINVTVTLPASVIYSIAYQDLPMFLSIFFGIIFIALIIFLSLFYLSLLNKSTIKIEFQKIFENH